MLQHLVLILRKFCYKCFHFHILICGINKKNIEDYFAHLYPLEYQFKLNRDTFIVSKKNDPLIYERPQKLKIVDIETVKDSEKIASYMCKFKTYMTYMEQQYLTVIVDKNEDRIRKGQSELLSQPTLACGHAPSFLPTGRRTK